MDENTLVKDTTTTVSDDDKADYEREIADKFTRVGDNYHYNGAPSQTIFTDNGDTITSSHEFDVPEVADAMTALAVAKGWGTWEVYGADQFYKAVAQRTEQIISEREAEQSANAVTAESVADDIERVQAKNAAALLAVQDQYRVNGSRYYFKDQIGRSNTLAFKDKGDKLTAGINTERVTKNMVQLAAAKGWTSIRVSGHKEFKRQAWREAVEQGIAVQGYTPTPEELATVIKATENVVANANSQERTAAVNAGSQSVGTSTRDHSGVLVKHGAAPYKFDNDASPSYYATVDTDTGERTTWGVDLERAISESGVDVGDNVSLSYEGRKAVTVTAQVLNEATGKREPQEIETVRNTWNIDRAEALKAVGTAVAVDRITDDASRAKVINAISQRVDQVQGDLPNVPVYDPDAPKPVQSQPQPTRKQSQPELELTR